MPTDTNRYYVFYTYAYGMQAEQKVIDDYAEMIALVKKAKEPESPYLGFTVIWGRKLEFEPATIVETWKIKQDGDG